MGNDSIGDRRRESERQTKRETVLHRDGEGIRVRTEGKERKGKNIGGKGK